MLLNEYETHFICKMDRDSSHITPRFNFQQHPQVGAQTSSPFISSRLAGIPRRLMTAMEKEPMCVFAAMSVPLLLLALNREVLAKRTSCLALTGRWAVWHTATGLSTNILSLLEEFKSSPCSLCAETPKRSWTFKSLLKMYDCL